MTVEEKKPFISEFEKDAKKRIHKMIKDNYSLREFCSKSPDISYPSMEKMLNNKQRMSLTHLDQILKVLNSNFLPVFSDEKYVKAEMIKTANGPMNQSFIHVPIVPLWSFERNENPLEAVTGHQCFEKNFILEFDDPIITTISDKAMTPLLGVGDLFLVSRGITDRANVTPDNCYLIKDPKTNKVLVRRVGEHKLRANESMDYPDVHLYLYPINTDYSIQEIIVETGNIEDVVLGRVVWMSKKL